jgi:hypothetical protein
MADDLVTRLRDLADEYDVVEIGVDFYFTEAADEIERLRALVRDNGTPRFNAVCERAEKAEAEIKRLRDALREVISVSDRKTDIYDRAKAALAGETL